MKAVVFERAGEMSVLDVDEPAIGPTDLLVAMRQMGICHSDFDLLADNYIMPVQFPVTPGHEWAGEVVAIGADVTGFEPGDRIVGECTVNGGMDHFGFSISGAGAELFRIRSDWAHKLPDDVSFEAGATVEPFSCAYYALNRVGRVNAADTVAVVGGGPIGLSAVAAASAMGARVVLIEPASHRRDVGMELGAEHQIDPTGVDLVDAIGDLTGGRLADVTVEASGNPAAMASSFDIVGFRGRMAFIGINVGGRANAKLGQIQSKELRIHGTIGSPDIWPETIRFISTSGLDLSPLITARFPLEEALDAFAASERRDEQIKVHLTNPA